MSQFNQSLTAFIEEELGYDTEHVQPYFSYGKETGGEVGIIEDPENYSFKWDCVQENKDNADFWYWIDEQIDAVEITTAMEQTYLDIYRTLPGKIIAETTGMTDVKTVWESVALVFGLLEEV